MVLVFWCHLVFAKAVIVTFERTQVQILTRESLNAFLKTFTKMQKYTV